MSYKPVVLVIRDGWGENHDRSLDKWNAIRLADAPCARDLSANWPRTEIAACGRDVGLPNGIMGNSEVGHQNIGAGRIVDQEIVRIDKGFETKAVKMNPVVQAAFAREKKGGALHLFGLVSDAGVHSMLEHLYGLLTVAKEEGVKKVFIHCFTDGRDTPPTSGMGFIKQIEQKCAEIGVGQIASVTGRFWAMDRDSRWDRVQRAYDALTGVKIERTAKTPSEAVKFYYDNPLDDSRKGDEFIVPTAIVGADGKPVAIIGDGDAVIFFNFRGDRPREITRAFIEEGFNGFPRARKLDLYYATMTEYQKGLCPNVIFRKPEKMKNILGSYVADKGIAQFRCAETRSSPTSRFSSTTTARNLPA
jgi:2,3-bisphosphoglycerate-independent phosphoglycerate mutase